MNDLTDKKFNRLTVIERKGNDIFGHLRWLCRCDCGKEKIIVGSHMVRGKTKSCGCLNKEKLVARSLKHGHNRREKVSQVYSIWANLIQRCTNRNNQDYLNYGGRGITVCEKWLESFENFLEDMGQPPTKQHQIDRIDNNKGYDKNNCRWVTRKQQSQNRRSNHFLTHNGKTQTTMEWSRETGITYGTLLARINRHNWDIDRALTAPTRKKGR